MSFSVSLSPPISRVLSAPQSDCVPRTSDMEHGPVSPVQSIKAQASLWQTTSMLFPSGPVIQAA